MNFFELSWTWYENYVPHIFAHDSKTNEEFDIDVKTLMIKYGPEYIQQESNWVGAPGWIMYIVTKLPEFGYIPVIRHSFSIFGANIIKGHHDNDDFNEIVGKDLINMAVKHNRLIDRKIRRKLYA